MKLGVVISSNDPETVWNAFRFGNFALKAGDEVRVFLMGKGVEADSLDTEAFQIKEQMRALVGKNGKIYACGTCLKSRESQGSELCPLSTMQDMYNLVKESDKVVTF